MRTLIVVNNTSSQISYLSGLVIVPGSGNITVADAYKPQLALNQNIRSDILAGNVALSDGVSSSNYGLPYLDYFIPSLAQDNISNTTQMQALSVGTTAVAAIGGVSILSGRKILIICPANGTVYWGNSSSVTISNGLPIFQNQVLQLSFTDAVPIYLIASSTTNVVVFEGS
jgi:hypothetical protein